MGVYWCKFCSKQNKHRDHTCFRSKSVFLFVCVHTMVLAFTRYFDASQQPSDVKFLSLLNIMLCALKPLGALCVFLFTSVLSHFRLKLLNIAKLHKNQHHGWILESWNCRNVTTDRNFDLGYEWRQSSENGGKFDSYENWLRTVSETQWSKRCRCITQSNHYGYRQVCQRSPKSVKGRTD